MAYLHEENFSEQLGYEGFSSSSLSLSLFFFFFFKDERVLEYCTSVGIQYQTVEAGNLKEHCPKHLVFVLRTEKSLYLIDLRERGGP